MSNIRCKMKVENVEVVKSDDTIKYERIALSAVTSGSKENKEFSKFTPFAKFDIQIDNPNAFGKLLMNQEYYIDLIPVSLSNPKDKPDSEKSQCNDCFDGQHCNGKVKECDYPCCSKNPNPKQN